MTVNTSLVNDIWSFEDAIKRSTSDLFNPRPDARDAQDVVSVTAGKRERYEVKRLALLYFVDGLLTESPGALQYASELASAVCAAKKVLPPVLDVADFDVVAPQPQVPEDRSVNDEH